MAGIPYNLYSFGVLLMAVVTNRGGDDMEPYEGVSARCALCDGEIYRGEEYYHINGQAVCRDCLAEYAVQVFAPYLVKGG